MKTIDFAKTHKELYTAKRKVQEVVAGSGTFFAVDGQGKPGGNSFQSGIQSLYAALYTVKFTLKLGGRLDFKVNKLECLYFSDPAATPMSEWQWQMLARVPDEVTGKDPTQARRSIRAKKDLDISAVKRIRWKEGRALQVMHVGPYEQMGGTYEQLHRHAAEHGLVANGPAHEIYLSDPRRTAPERLKTIARLSVKKK